MAGATSYQESVVSSQVWESFLAYDTPLPPSLPFCIVTFQINARSVIKFFSLAKSFSPQKVQSFSFIGLSLPQRTGGRTWTLCHNFSAFCNACLIS